MDTVFSFLAESFDLPILDWIADNLTCPLLDAAMPFITKLGDHGIFWISLTVLMLLLPKTRKAGLTMALALLTGLLVCNVVMKPLFARIRPYDYQFLYHDRVIPLLIEAEKDFSFPSGHTIASFEAAVVLLKNSKKMGIPAMILAVLISFSRMYLYVHYPTDVLASIILGTLFALIGDAIAAKVAPRLGAGKKGKYEA